MARKQINFTVTGRGEFPFDMLRHDRCYPIGSVSALRMGHDYRRDHRCITMATENPTGPTVDRWRSFGWQVEILNL